MSKQIVSGPAALTKILEGVNLIANAVKATLGPNGRNCVYERVQTNQPISTRDGVTVANQIEADDPHANMGVEMLKGVAREAVDQSGDGTTTATLLAQAIFAEGVKAVTVGANPVALKRGVEKATGAVVAALKSMAIPVRDDMVRQVATISANNDEFLGGLIASAMKRAGDDGVVTVEISRKPESELVIVDGMEFGTGFISPYFINNPERNECILENVYVLLHERKLATILPMRELLKKISDEGASLLVIAEDVTDEALGILAVNAQKGSLKACAVKSPGGLDHLNDIAALTGARVVTELLGVKLQDVGIDFLGKAQKVVVKAHSTTIITEKASTTLAKRLRELRSQVETATDDGTKMRTQARLARLSGGVAIIKVGAMTELEMNERKDRIEDAMHATRCAMKEGVLPGGGLGLLNAAKATYGLDVEEADETVGIQLVMKACEAPLRTLAANSGKSAQHILAVIAEEKEVNYGWNARTNNFENLLEAGVLDPLRVVRVALESASSVASLMLITDTLVSNKRA